MSFLNFLIGFDLNQILQNQLEYNNPLLMQSMYIFKQPNIGGEVVCHQDSTFLNTEPDTVIGFWVACRRCNN